MGNVASEEYWGDKIPKVEGYGQDHRLNIKSVKLFTDGMRAKLYIPFVT
jgi:hypothetical protein